MGKVWESGAVQVVQCADSLSDDSHPRNRLPGGLQRRAPLSAECSLRLVGVASSSSSIAGRSLRGTFAADAADAAECSVQGNMQLLSGGCTHRLLTHPPLLRRRADVPDC